MRNPRGFALSSLCKKKTDGGGLVAHLLEEEGRGAEEGARRGEKEGLAGAESLISKQNTFEIERPKGILTTPKR